MNKKYYGDDRYEKIYEQMQLLGIQDVSSKTQDKNGTIVWRLPMKGRGNTHIEYASFATGYVRNQGNQCHSNWQINTRVDDEPRYFELPNGDYRKYVGKVCKLIPIEIDRLEYMMKYVIKNDFIKRANMLYTDFVPKHTLEATEGYYKDKLKVYKENAKFHEKRALKQYEKLASAEARADELSKTVVEHGIDNQVKDVQVIVDGTRYKVI